MTPGHVIILNGTSSAGKSSLAKALQAQLADPYLHLGIDTIVFALPKRYLNPPLWHEIFQYTWPEPGVMEIEAGPMGHRLISGLHHTVAALAQAGNNVIVDHVLLDPGWVHECAHLLSGLPALLVGVICPLAVVEQRERDRQDRTLGQARAQFDKVHAHGLYDVTVDTSLAPPEVCAAQLSSQINSSARSAALAKLQSIQQVAP